MKTSAAGRALITQREGRRLTAYYDSQRILTIGVGHTGRMSPPPVTVGMRITEEQCDAFLTADLAPVEAEINKRVKVPLTQNEFDAMASWLFNVGQGWLRKSTILARLNAGDIQGAANGFDLFHKPPEIIGRRNSEKAQFLRPDTQSKAVVVERAKVLSTKAEKAAGQAKAAGQGSTAIAVAAGVTAVATVSHHHSIVPLVAVIVVVIAALAGGIFVFVKKAKSQTLAGNAQRQADHADIGTASTDLADGLKT